VVGAKEMQNGEQQTQLSKTPVINAISLFDLSHPLSLESVKLSKLRKISAIHPPDRPPRWSPSFELPQLLRSSVKFGEVKENLFGEAPNH